MNKNATLLDLTEDGHLIDIPVPGLARYLEKMFYLRLDGYTMEEAEKMCEPKPVTEEERDVILKNVMKEQQKELRHYNRMLKKQAEERELQNIYKKAF